MKSVMISIKPRWCELIARNTTPGWDVWGNEVNKYGN